MKFVIRAGGIGTRLWPYSRQRKPKQFHAMAGEQTMLQDAVGRIGSIAAADDVHVSTGAQMADLVREQLPALSAAQLIVEPALRNTGPAVGLECALLEARYPGCVIASLGSDHYIGKAGEFCRLLQVAEAAITAHPDYLFTLGVKPTRAETGYGYIQRGVVLAEFAGEPVYGVEAFKEKPDASTAARYVASGEYLWNSNMFAWKAATVLELFARFEPALHEGLERIMAAVGSAEEGAVIAREYPRLKEIAVDNAIIERAEKVATIEADIDWGDIGSWAALTDVLPADSAGNLFAGEVVAIDAANSTVYARKDRLVALIGVEDLVVVDTEDALLVCKKGEAQRVKDVLERLQEDKYRKYT
ncbi:MAG: sugar phosphate nucleotidyltransferase [Candidatus Latescibacteria bacterium]|jgi:mannose-1-phosphate guanylyltransferase|nr:sugar phosphate nucleotidyltransferase [Candidatus Latescibacterota bacterium]